MGFYESVVRPALFSLDPEKAHNLGLAAVARGLVSCGPVAHRPGLERTAFGVRFPNPIGLAAGFDKNAVAVDRWRHLGFGFVEIGTVTLHPQPGNPKPRLFRLTAERGIINRLGFNNDGAEAVARRLESARPGIPLGVNIGKSKVADLEDAAADYAGSFRLLARFADYVVVNVSSPNTPGLRGLQEREPLTRILSGLRAADPAKPLLVKIAPDLDEPGLDDIVAVAEEVGLAGIVATNTTVSRSSLANDPCIDGGLSGAPLTSLSNQTLSLLGKRCRPELVLVGVGGIMTPADAKQRFESGAHLVQVYSGWVYAGPGFVPSLLEALPESGA